MEAADDYSFLFKELFCVAAQDLAEQVHEQLGDIGVLYNDIMNTGTIESKRTGSIFGKTNDTTSDAEKGQTSVVFGRGQLLFVVRMANKIEATRLQASGFRFADIHNIADPLARRMQVTRKELVTFVDGMREYSKNDRDLEPGVHLACFALRPLVRRSFDILVRTNATNLLPTVRMPLEELDKDQIQLLRRMEGWTVSACLKSLRNQLDFNNRSEQVFVDEFYRCLTTLAEQIEHPFFLDARLVGHPIDASRGNRKNGHTSTNTTFLAFRVIADIHTSLPNSNLMFSPYSFFKCQQDILNQSSADEGFANEVLREFSPVLDAKASPFNVVTRNSTQTSSNLARDILNRNRVTRSINHSWPFASRNTSLELVRGDSSSEKNLVAGAAGQAYGGITVRNDIRIEISKRENVSSDGAGVELKNMAIRKAPSVAVTEDKGSTEAGTFFDELLNITLSSTRR